MNASTKVASSKSGDTFRERLGKEELKIDSYKVDDLRKIASEYDISGSHDMHKEELVDAINKVRKSEMAK
jgi:hypothetical protein